MYKKDIKPLRPRRLPKLYSCMTKASLELLQSKLLYGLELLDAKGVRRMQKPLHECFLLELQDGGYIFSAQCLHDIIYDNQQLLKQDDLGIIVNLSKREDYLEQICKGLKYAEKEHDKSNTEKESESMLQLAEYFAEKEKGILWLAEKFYNFAIVIASRHLIDGGRQKARCKYFYAIFLIDKFPGVDDDEPFELLSEVRKIVIGKTWYLHDADDQTSDEVSFFNQVAIQLHRVLLNKSKVLRTSDSPKAERLARLAEKRAVECSDVLRRAEAVLEIGICQMAMNDLNNSNRTMSRALKLYESTGNIHGICESKMHLACVLARMGAYEIAENLLTDMGILAMIHGLHKHLGHALHLLGELHVKNGEPAMGSLHLYEAFQCFMGQSVHMASELLQHNKNYLESNVTHTYPPDEKEVYLQEAEQSRLMTAVCAAQELMASYFEKICEANECQVARLKCIEWKLDRSAWWKRKHHHDYQPCSCPIHNRTVLDVMRLKLSRKRDQDDDNDEDVSDISEITLSKSCTAFVSALDVK